MDEKQVQIKEEMNNNPNSPIKKMAEITNFQFVDVSKCNVRKIEKEGYVMTLVRKTEPIPEVSLVAVVEFHRLQVKFNSFSHSKENQC